MTGNQDERDFIFRLGEDEPDIHPQAWVAPTAAIIGKVEIGAGSSVWFNC